MKESIGAVCADATKCVYCVSWHTTAARKEGYDQKWTEILRQFNERKNEIPEKERAALEYARQVATEAYKVTDSQVENLRKVGWSDPEIMEITWTAAYLTCYAKFNTALDIEYW